MFFNRKRRVYLDFASATPVFSDALDVMRDVQEFFGNPGALHAEASLASLSLERSRAVIAHEIGCKAREVVFVSGGTEANNLALLGFARALEKKGTDLSKTHWVVSAIEHPSVLECFGEIERQGAKITFIDPDERGRITEDTLLHALRVETVLVSIGWGNHEIGTLQQLSRLSRVIRAHESAHGTSVLFHSDAGQAPIYRVPQVNTLGVDLMTFDAGKLYGPRGVGVLFISNRVELAPLFFGGGQERGLRPGSEPVALAAGFARAFQIITRDRHTESLRLQKLASSLRKTIEISTLDVVFNGDEEHCLPHIINISVPGIDAEYVTLALDREGCAISTKSACREGEARASHVVAAIERKQKNVKPWRAEHTLRFSLGRQTSESDVKFAAEKLSEVIRLFRKSAMI